MPFTTYGGIITASEERDVGILEATLPPTTNDSVSGGKPFSAEDVNSPPPLSATLFCHFEKETPFGGSS